VFTVSLKKSFLVSSVPPDPKQALADFFVGETLLLLGGQLMVDTIAN
jgi:hypothetical protein